MNTPSARSPVTMVLIAVAVVAVAGCGTRGQEPAPSLQAQADVQAQAADVTNPCTALGTTPVELSATLPSFFSAVGTQINADCLAWQEFIYLNWKADPSDPGRPDQNAPPSSFGSPNDTSATVWESFFEASEVFAGGTVWSAPRTEQKTLMRLAKLGDADISLHSTGQAGDGKWLTDHRGGLAFYEVRMNEDEYDFITKNVFNGSDLTTYAGQLACAQQPGSNGRGGFNLPSGTASGHTDVDCAGTPVSSEIVPNLVEGGRAAVLKPGSLRESSKPFTTKENRREETISHSGFREATASQPQRPHPPAQPKLPTHAALG